MAYLKACVIQSVSSPVLLNKMAPKCVRKRYYTVVLLVYVILAWRVMPRWLTANEFLPKQWRWVPLEPCCTCCSYFLRMYGTRWACLAQWGFTVFFHLFCCDKNLALETKYISLLRTIVLNVRSVSVDKNRLKRQKHSWDHSWWHHTKEIFSASLALCQVNPPINNRFPSQKASNAWFDIFFSFYFFLVFSCLVPLASYLTNSRVISDILTLMCNGTVI